MPYTTFEHSSTKHDILHWQKQYEIVQKKLDQQNIQFDEHRNQQTVLNQQLLMLRDEVKELKDQNKLLAHEKWEIAQEKAQLDGINKQMQKMIRTQEVA